jgi:predicted transcriptional regulator
MAANNYDRVIKEITPMIKASATKMMTADYGLKQQNIAKLLDITQAAVSKYLNGDIKTSGKALDPKVVKSFVESLIRGDRIGAQKYKCLMCQTYERFDCNLMVK